MFLPLSFYSDYTVEHRFELSNQTPGGWLTDEVKGLAVSLVIVIPLGIGGYRLLGLALAWWWVYAAFLWTGFGFILAYLAPVLIMPLFNKFIPLDDAELKEEIVELAEHAKLKLSDILRTDMSRRTKNALSRRFERQADIFELRLVGQPQAAISTFKKLAAQNLADPSPSPLIVFLLYSHPPVAERIETAARFGEGDPHPLA